MAAKRKKKANLEHVLDLEMGLHLKTGGDGGACLTRHVSAYEDGNSCSHRFQAYRRAREYPHWFNYPAYESLASVDPAKPTRVPAPGDWDLGASSKVWRYVNGARALLTVPNFRENANVPYYHNAHHIIPNSVLNGSLLTAAKADMALFYLTRAGLLEAKYNLNDKANMVLLPMRKKVAAAFCLPRHIAGIDTEPGVAPHRINHPAYNDKVRAKVSAVISDYARQLDTKKHDKDLPAFSKMKLLEISETLFMQLRVWGSVARGQAIDVMPDPDPLFQG